MVNLHNVLPPLSARWPDRRPKERKTPNDDAVAAVAQQLRPRSAVARPALTDQTARPQSSCGQRTPRRPIQAVAGKQRSVVTVRDLVNARTRAAARPKSRPCTASSVQAPPQMDESAEFQREPSQALEATLVEEMQNRHEAIETVPYRVDNMLLHASQALEFMAAGPEPMQSQSLDESATPIVDDVGFFNLEYAATKSAKAQQNNEMDVSAKELAVLRHLQDVMASMKRCSTDASAADGNLRDSSSATGDPHQQAVNPEDVANLLKEAQRRGEHRADRIDMTWLMYLTHVQGNLNASHRRTVAAATTKEIQERMQARVVLQREYANLKSRYARIGDNMREIKLLRERKPGSKAAMDRQEQFLAKKIEMDFLEHFRQETADLISATRMRATALKQEIDVLKNKRTEARIEIRRTMQKLINLFRDWGTKQRNELKRNLKTHQMSHDDIAQKADSTRRLDEELGRHLASTYQSLKAAHGTDELRTRLGVNLDEETGVLHSHPSVGDVVGTVVDRVANVEKAVLPDSVFKLPYQLSQALVFEPALQLNKCTRPYECSQLDFRAMQEVLTDRSWSAEQSVGISRIPAKGAQLQRYLVRMELLVNGLPGASRVAAAMRRLVHDASDPPAALKAQQGGGDPWDEDLVAEQAAKRAAVELILHVLVGLVQFLARLHRGCQFLALQLKLRSLNFRCHALALANTKMRLSNTGDAGGAAAFCHAQVVLSKCHAWLRDKSKPVLERTVAVGSFYHEMLSSVLDLIDTAGEDAAAREFDDLPRRTLQNLLQFLAAHRPVDPQEPPRTVVPSLSLLIVEAAKCLRAALRFHLRAKRWLWISLQLPPKPQFAKRLSTSSGGFSRQATAEERKARSGSKEAMQVLQEGQVLVMDDMLGYDGMDGDAADGDARHHPLWQQEIWEEEEDDEESEIEDSEAYPLGERAKTKVVRVPTLPDKYEEKLSEALTLSTYKSGLALFGAHRVRLGKAARTARQRVQSRAKRENKREPRTSSQVQVKVRVLTDFIVRSPLCRLAVHLEVPVDVRSEVLSDAEARSEVTEQSALNEDGSPPTCAERVCAAEMGNQSLANNGPNQPCRSRVLVNETSGADVPSPPATRARRRRRRPTQDLEQQAYEKANREQINIRRMENVIAAQKSAAVVRGMRENATRLRGLGQRDEDAQQRHDASPSEAVPRQCSGRMFGRRQLGCVAAARRKMAAEGCKSPSISDDQLHYVAFGRPPSEPESGLSPTGSATDDQEPAADELPQYGSSASSGNEEQDASRRASHASERRPSAVGFRFARQRTPSLVSERRASDAGDRRFSICSLRRASDVGEPRHSLANLLQVPDALGELRSIASQRRASDPGTRGLSAARRREASDPGTRRFSLPTHGLASDPGEQLFSFASERRALDEDERRHSAPSERPSSDIGELRGELCLSITPAQTIVGRQQAARPSLRTSYVDPLFDTESLMLAVSRYKPISPKQADPMLSTSDSSSPSHAAHLRSSVAMVEPATEDAFAPIPALQVTAEVADKRNESTTGDFPAVYPESAVAEPGGKRTIMRKCVSANELAVTMKAAGWKPLYTRCLVDEGYGSTSTATTGAEDAQHQMSDASPSGVCSKYKPGDGSLQKSAAEQAQTLIIDDAYTYAASPRANSPTASCLRLWNQVDNPFAQAVERDGQVQIDGAKNTFENSDSEDLWSGSTPSQSFPWETEKGSPENAESRSSAVASSVPNVQAEPTPRPQSRNRSPWLYLGRRGPALGRFMPAREVPTTRGYSPTLCDLVCPPPLEATAVDPAGHCDVDVLWERFVPCPPSSRSPRAAREPSADDDDPQFTLPTSEDHSVVEEPG